MQAWSRLDRVERVRRSHLSPPPRVVHMGSTAVRGVGDWDPLIHLGSQFGEHLPQTFAPTAYLSVRPRKCRIAPPA